MKINYKKLLICLFIPLLVGGLSALLTSKNINLFDTINKPLLTPPGWIFPVTWTILFILMGIASYFVLENNYSDKSIIYYTIQLIVNFFWSIIFFNFKAYLLSTLWILLLLYLIIKTTILFFKDYKLAGYLFLPYVLWVSFATYLTFTIFLIN